MLNDNLIIQFPKIGSDDQGYISVAEVGNTCLFQIERTYWVYGCPGGMQRGGHAHYALEQILICVAGEVEVILTDGFSKKVFCLNDPSLGLHIPVLVWRDIVYKQNSVLLVLASATYSTEDYIRDYQTFYRVATDLRAKAKKNS